MHRGPWTSRRAVLRGAGLLPVALATGCAGATPRPAPSPSPVDPDDVLREQAGGRERALLEAYDAAIAAAPDRAVELLALKGQHAAHLQALASDGVAASPGPTPPTADATAGPDTPTVVTTRPPAPVLARVIALERTAAGQHAAAAATAADGDLAGLMATLAASEASHVAALT